MNKIQKKERRFWDRFANFYDFFIDKVFRETYATILKNIDSDLDLSQIVLEIGTGTGIIPFSIYSKVSTVIATVIGSISGFKIFNQWSYIGFISMLKKNGLVICKDLRIEGKILTAYVVMKKIVSN